MINAEVEPWIHRYVVTTHLHKALERDKKHTGELKMSTIWNGLMETLQHETERECRSIMRQLQLSGCRILDERMTEEKTYQIRYLYRGYEFHCDLLPVVLKRKCEDKLKQLLHRHH